MILIFITWHCLHPSASVYLFQAVTTYRVSSDRYMWPKFPTLYLPHRKLYIRNFQPINNTVHHKLDGTTYIYFLEHFCHAWLSINSRTANRKKRLNNDTRVMSDACIIGYMLVICFRSLSFSAVPL